MNTAKIPFSEIVLTYSRSSGSGGQNVNKVNTKAVLKWDITNTLFLSEEIKLRLLQIAKNLINKNGLIVISSETFRTQEANKNSCLNKLSKLITQASIKPKKRKKSKISKNQKEKRIKDKKNVSMKKTTRSRVRDY